MNSPAENAAPRLSLVPPSETGPEVPLPRFSVIAPMLNEAENVGPMAREIAEACAGLEPFEVLFVNDGSTDGTAAAIAALRAEFPWLREIRHARPCGQSAALRSGVLAARAPVVCTIDGDGQNPPAEIPRLVAPLLESRSGGGPDGGSDGRVDGLAENRAENRARGLGLVAGQRIDRKDRKTRRLASRFANGLRGWLLRDHTRDTGCGLKAFPRDVFLRLPYFDHVHRFLPALVRRDGYEIMLIDVAHRPRTAGRTKYTNVGRAMVGLLDLLGVWWLLRRRRIASVVHEDPWCGDS
jgi:dolichol-phosphate mannosyltransferase